MRVHNSIKRLYNFFKPLSLKKYTVWYIFFGCASAMTLFQLHPTILDPDSFYHARIAMLITHGPLMRFPWLPLTDLSTLFIDHHFLYHVLLIPFVMFINPLVGIKIATVLFASILCVLFYLLLRSPSMTHGSSRTKALFFLILLLLDSMFLFRINLAKIPALSLIFFLLGLYAISIRHTRALFGISFLFVWLYGGWPILPFASFMAWISIALGAMQHEKKFALLHFLKRQTIRIRINEWLHNTWTSLFTWSSLRIPVASIGGALAGLIINPYFPTNLSFYWVQTIKIAALNILSNISVGSEWYPAGISFIPSHGLTLIALLFATCIFFLPELFARFLHTHISKRTANQWMLFVLTIIFLFLTLKSQRYGEYFVPLSMLFSGSVLMEIATHEQIKKLSAFIRRSLVRPFSYRGITTIYFLFMLPALITTNLLQVFLPYTGGYPFTQYKQGMAWIQTHIPNNVTIFHNRWDDFPLFFYYDQTHRYISGLDPRFLFEQNAALAKDFDQIGGGEDSVQSDGYRPLCFSLFLSAQKKNDKKTSIANRAHYTIPGTCFSSDEKQTLEKKIRSFGSSYMILTHGDDPANTLAQKIRTMPNFHELYRDNEMVVYTIIPQSPSSAVPE